MTGQFFNIDLNKSSLSTKKDKTNREKNLKLFLNSGLPSKKDENWKFTDLNFILKNNFKNVSNDYKTNFDTKIDLINDFEHNSIFLVNGLYKSSNIKFVKSAEAILKNFTSLFKKIADFKSKGVDKKSTL